MLNMEQKKDKSEQKPVWELYIRIWTHPFK